MRTQFCIVALLSSLLGLSDLCAEFLYTVDFNGAHLDSRLYIVDLPKFGARLTGTQVELLKEEGAEPYSGDVNIYSSFYLTGDFSITIRGFRGLVRRPVGWGYSQLRRNITRRCT